MNSGFKKLRRVDGEGQYSLLFWCPGCQDLHSVVIAPGRWSWNNDSDHPTFSPGVHVTSGHYTPDFKPGEACWCTFNAAHPREPSSFRCINCNSFVIEGLIHFGQDCTHKLAGQRIPIPEWRE